MDTESNFTENQKFDKSLGSKTNSILIDFINKSNEE